MKPALFLQIAVIALMGCKAEPAAKGSASAAPEAPVEASASAAPAPAAQARAVSESTDLYEFDYAYPAAAAAIPGLKAWLEEDSAQVKAKLVKDATAWQAEAKAGDIPFNAYAHSTKWDVVTDLPGWLSLSAQRYAFTGGAHGMPWSEGLIWDKTANARRGALDLFTSPAALSAAIRAPFCAEIDRQRAKKRGEAVKPGSTDMFDECIDPAKSQIILGSADGQHFTRIGVLVDPYEAGPYAEGAYEVTLPVTAAVLKAVKDDYRSAFALGR